jgi:hypothetical protein
MQKLPLIMLLLLLLRLLQYRQLQFVSFKLPPGHHHFEAGSESHV